MSQSIRLVKTLEVENELGEGIIWDSHRECIWWTDVEQSKLFQYHFESGELQHFSTPERLACLSPIQSDPRLICAFESGFAFFDPASGETQWIAQFEQDNPGTRFNDGKVDRAGRFWAGTMTEDPDKATYKGRLYCLDHDLSVSEHLGGLSITNSLCWSPNGQYAYHTDTPSRKIMRYVNGATPSLSEPEVLVKTERGAYPDGSCVDAQGYIWNAQWAGSQVVRYSPEGKQDLIVKVPASQATCPAFVGPKLNYLAVTSAYTDLSSEQRSKEPQAGHVFIYETPFLGLADQPFKLA